MLYVLMNYTTGDVVGSAACGLSVRHAPPLSWLCRPGHQMCAVLSALALFNVPWMSAPSL